MHITDDKYILWLALADTVTLLQTMPLLQTTPDTQRLMLVQGFTDIGL